MAQQTAAIDQALAQIGLAEMEMNWSMSENIDEDIVWEIEDLKENSEDKVGLEDWDKNNDMISKLKTIKASTPIHGNKNARFTIVEYSEFFCWYCKRQSNEGTINSVLEKYPTEVNAVFRNFVVHWWADKLAEGVACVWELWSEKDYFNFIEKAFAYEGNLSVEIFAEIAGDLGIKAKDFNKCIEEWRYKEEIAKQSKEGRELFNVQGTPWNVIIDSKTGKFVLIPGAYPAEKFIEEIEKLKNN
jgi:protein-disulfide isomerase